jgi:hypothetical protein
MAGASSRVIAGMVPPPTSGRTSDAARRPISRSSATRESTDLRWVGITQSTLSTSGWPLAVSTCHSCDARARRCHRDLLIESVCGVVVVRRQTGSGECRSHRHPRQGVMFGILETAGPHSPIGRGTRLKIVSVRVRVPVGVLPLGDRGRLAAMGAAAPTPSRLQPSRRAATAPETEPPSHAGPRGSSPDRSISAGRIIGLCERFTTLAHPF